LKNTVTVVGIIIINYIYLYKYLFFHFFIFENFEFSLDSSVSLVTGECTRGGMSGLHWFDGWFVAFAVGEGSKQLFVVVVVVVTVE